jgi:hypothetical protein
LGRSHSLSFDHRLRPDTLRAAMATAFDQHDQLLAARDAGIEQVPLQHGVMLGEHRDNHGGIFRTLAFVDGRSVAGTSMSSSPNPCVTDRPSKFGNELARIGIDVVDGANIAVVDLLFVVVLDLHHLVVQPNHRPCDHRRD